MNNETKNALELYQGQANLVDKIWWYFATVTLGVVGFVTASISVRGSSPGMSVLTITYLIFAIGNAISLRRTQLDLNYIADEIKVLSNTNPALKNRFRSFSAGVTSSFHGVLALLTVVLLGFYLYRSFFDC